MAVVLRRMNKMYSARIRLPKTSPKTERLITLKTRSKKVAEKRIAEVKLFETEIKNGYDVLFSWQTESGKTEFKNTTLGEIADQYTDYRKIDIESPVRPRTHVLIVQHVGHFVDHFGRSKKVTLIRQSDVDAYKIEIAQKYAATTTNINLRTLRTMWNWFKKQGYSVNEITFKQIAEPHRKPIYFSNDEFEKILKVSEPFCQEVFKVYRDTGMRLREGFNGEIHGNWLIVPPELSKGRREREIPLNDVQLKVMLELQTRSHTDATADRNNLQRSTHLPDYYSRAFKDALEKVGIVGKTFKGLRHTAALRFYLKSRDLYYVQKMLGHAHIQTTEIYSDYSLQRLAQDFPDLVETDENGMPIFTARKEVFF